MRKTKPTYQQLEKRLGAAEPIVDALKRQEVDAVVGEEKIAFLLLRKVEEAWLQSNGEFSAMFDLTGIGMMQADFPACRFIRVNPKFCEIAGYSTEELLKKTYIGLTYPQDQERDMKKIALLIRGKSDTWSIEKRLVHKDGSVIWVSVHGAALRNHDGQAVRITAMIEDITARKQAEHQQRDALEQLKKKFDERAAEMSQMLRSLRRELSSRKPADQVLRAVQEFINRSVGSPDEKSPATRSKPLPRRKAPSKITTKSVRQSSSDKRRHRAR